MSRLYSYVVARDFGFAPNPFFGWCTLATCKPNIRRVAQEGNWVVGVGSAANRQPSKLVYVMRVGETMTFNEYWQDPRFAQKRPSFGLSMKYAFGDNIYHRETSDEASWIQANSHHSMADGTTNTLNLEADTQADRVLISSEFTYWGGEGPVIPAGFAQFIARRGHKSNFTPRAVEEFLDWCCSSGETGRVGVPLKWNTARTGGRRRSAA
jgi:hypothetical protein